MFIDRETAAESCNPLEKSLSQAVLECRSKKQPHQSKAMTASPKMSKEASTKLSDYRLPGNKKMKHRSVICAVPSLTGGSL